MLPCATCWNGDGFLVCYSYSRHRHLDVDLGTQRCVPLLLRRCGCRKKAKPTASSCGPVPRFAGLTPPASVPGLDPPQPTSVPGLGSPRAHPRGDWTRRCHTRRNLQGARRLGTGPFGRAGAIGRSAGRTGPEWCAPLRRAHGYSHEIQEVWKRYSRGTHAVLTRYSGGAHAVLTR